MQKTAVFITHRKCVKKTGVLLHASIMREENWSISSRNENARKKLSFFLCRLEWFTCFAYPSSHVHEKDPSESAQVAFSWQLSVPRLHLLLSKQSKPLPSYPALQTQVKAGVANICPEIFKSRADPWVKYPMDLLQIALSLQLSPWFLHSLTKFIS
jgi:hypothetical protein